MSRPSARVFPPLPLGVYGSRARSALPFPLDRPTCALYSLARHGLAKGVERLGLRAGDEVLAPAYHHGSEIEAYARMGLGVRYYDATTTLAPDSGELESLLGSRVRALHLIHYLGFPQDAPRWRRWCDERGLLLIEDAAQAWLAAGEAPVGSSGQLAIFSLYKTVGVPDGGAVICAEPLPAPGGGRALRATRLAKAHRSWLALRWPRLAHPRMAASGAGGIPHGEFALGDVESAPSSLTRWMLPRLLAAADVPATRRRNYARLLAGLQDRVPPPFDRLPGGASPFAFPVESGAKEELLRRLAGAGVKALDFWSVAHPSLPERGFPAAARRRARTIGLPVHQELLPRHLELMREVVAGDDSA